MEVYWRGRERITYPWTDDPPQPATMEFSQAVARTVCRLQGRDLAAITWEAIGKARMSGMPLTLAEVVVQSPLDLHGQAELPPGFPRSSITGIVTAAGLPSQFGVRVEPFVLLEELEQRLRRLLEAVHSQLRSHRRNRVRDADDLTLGGSFRSCPGGSLGGLGVGRGSGPRTRVTQRMCGFPEQTDALQSRSSSGHGAFSNRGVRYSGCGDGRTKSQATGSSTNSALLHLGT